LLGIRGGIIVDNTHPLVVERSSSINRLLSELASLQVVFNWAF